MGENIECIRNFIDVYLDSNVFSFLQGGYRKEVNWWVYGKVEEVDYWHVNNITDPLNLLAYFNGFKIPSGKINTAFSRALPQSNEDGYTNQPVIIDASVMYSQDNTGRILKGIHHSNEQAKLLYILRDPVEKVFSNYRFDAQLMHKGFTEQSPEGFHSFVRETIDNIQANKTSNGVNIFYESTYVKQIQYALDIFGTENVKVLQYEQFVKTPLSIMENAVLPFLNLPPYESSIRKRLDQRAHRATNKSKLQYSMLNATRTLLCDFMRPYTKKLSELLGHDKWTWGY